MPRLEAALRRYRARPSNANFVEVDRLLRPRLLGLATRVLARRPGRKIRVRGEDVRLPIGRHDLRDLGAVDDAVVEGLAAAAAGARRFAYRCVDCVEVFTYRRDLVAHSRAAHGLGRLAARGRLERVTLECFCETAARIAVRGLAGDLDVPEVATEASLMTVAVDSGERAVVLRLLVRQVEGELAGAAREVLEQLGSRRARDREVLERLAAGSGVGDGLPGAVVRVLRPVVMRRLELNRAEAHARYLASEGSHGDVPARSAPRP